MDYYDKLVGLPPIRYLNLDKRIDKKDYMESQFEKWGIQNYTRISADRYGPHNFNEWENLLIMNERLNHIHYISILVNQLQSIIDWYYENSSETCLILEDDLNFVVTKFWPFDWQTIFSNLPPNWDCVQFHIIGEEFIPMGLSKRIKNNHGATCYMINRRYAEKLIKMHYIDGKFKFYDNYGYSKNWLKYHYQSPDFVPYEIGITYTFPIFISNTGFISDCCSNEINVMAKRSDYIVARWWAEYSKKYSISDLCKIYDNEDRKKELNVQIIYKNKI